MVRILAEEQDPAMIKTVNGLLRMQEALVDDTEQIDLFKQLDDAFHEALFSGVDQANLHRHIASRSGHLARMRTLDLPRTGKMREVLADHQAIVDAILTGDGIKAAAAMRQHLSGTIERLPDLRREHPDYFS